MHIVFRSFQVLVGVVTLLVGALLMVQVFSRYILNSSLAWGEEVSTFMMIWAGLLGAATLARQDHYISFSVLKNSANPAVRLISRLLAALATAVFSIILIYYGAQLSFFSAFSSRSSAAEIPLAWVYAIFPLAGAIALVGTLIYIWDLFRASK